MLTIKNTLRLEEPNWDESYADHYFELDVSGEIVIVAENKKELDEFDAVYDWVCEWIEDKVNIPFGWNVKWNAAIEGDIMTITVDEAKPDPFCGYDDGYFL